MRKLGLEPNARFAGRYDWAAIRAFYEDGHSAAECRRQFGFTMSAWADVIARGAIVPGPDSSPSKMGWPPDGVAVDST